MITIATATAATAGIGIRPSESLKVHRMVHGGHSHGFLKDCEIFCQDHDMCHWNIVATRWLCISEILSVRGLPQR